MTLTQDWMYIQYKQMLFVSVSASVPLTARAYVSVDGESYQEVSELLGQRTVLGYQPLFPIWMSGWLFADGQRIWVRIEDGEEVEEADYYVDYSVLAPKKAKARTAAANTLSSTTSSFTLENIFNVPHVTEMPTDGSSCWIVNEQGSISFGMALSTVQEWGPEDSSGYWPNTETRPIYANANLLFGNVDGSTPVLSRLNETTTASLSNKKIYVRFDLTGNDEALLYSLCSGQTMGDMTGFNAIFLYRTGNIVSCLTNIGTTVDWFYPYCLWTGKIGSQPPIITDAEAPEASNPVLINITDNEANFAALGLTTDEEIKNYLDAIPYEDIEKPIQIGDQPTTPEYNVGDTIFYGGKLCVIVYKADTEQSWGRYILCDKYDLVYYDPNLGHNTDLGGFVGKKWGENQDDSGAAATSVGTGKTNTDYLIGKYNTEDYLWYHVNLHRTDTGKPWSVPSKGEMSYVWSRRIEIGNFTLSNNGSYATSSQWSNYATWIQNNSHVNIWDDDAIGKGSTTFRVRLICYATDADLYNEHLANAYLDGVGLAFFWGKMKDYVDSALGSVQSILPIPLASCSIDGGSALLTLDATYSGYGEITVRYKKDSEPTEADTVLDPVNGAEITENGSYYVRAFGDSYTPSPSCIVEVSGIVVPVTVPMALPDGSVLFYDRGEQYGEYHVGSDGYLARDDGAVDDGTATSNNWRYLICDAADLSGTKQWCPSRERVSLQNDGIGYGLPNTVSMISSYTQSYHTDYWWITISDKRTSSGLPWFMPSKEELNQLYTSKSSIVNAGGSSFQSDYYWSSSEEDDMSAWAQNFSNGTQTAQGKQDSPYHCRLIRRV